MKKGFKSRLEDCMMNVHKLMHGTEKPRRTLTENLTKMTVLSIPV